MSTGSPDGRSIRVVIADDHTMFREGLKEMLSLDGTIEVVGEAENGEQAVEVVRRERPDVAILDIEMPVMGAREAMEQIQKLHRAPRIVIVSMFENSRSVREFLRLGASAYVAKSASLRELTLAVRAAAEKPRDGANVILSVPRHIMEQPELHEKCELSKRELEVLLLAARGYSNRQAASALGLAEATIKRHLANAFLKLGVGSRGEATRKALAKGWISTRDMIQKDL